MPAWTRDKGVEVVGAQTFEIEVLIQNLKDQLAVPDVQVWFVSRTNPKRRVRLLLPALRHDPQAGLMFERFDVSADEYAILVDRKIVSGTNDMRVLHRVGDLQYRFAEKQSLNERIARQFGAPRGWKGWDGSAPYVDMIRFDRWLPNRRHALLACLYNNFGDGPYKTIYYRVTLDTHTGRLSDHRHVPGQDVKWIRS